ncbi:MAG: DNA polymerase III subunit gamma/tau [Bacilli bacterium]
MAYKSLYRKYRPTTFDDVSGQTFIIKTLKNAIATNKISHAYLFSGTRGTGKTTIAKIFAKNVNCMNLIDGNVCGKCEICTTENTDDIQDIIEIDAASNNGVDEIRELKNKIKLAPVLCKYKVYIIDEVHMLSTGAFNALLKTLEEPPSHVIFILATTEPQKIPITIISRCQRFDFKKLSIIDIKNRLKYIAEKEHINITDDCLDEIAKMSDGAMRDAIGLLDQVSSFNEDSITIDDIYQISGSVPFKKIYELIDSYINEDIENILKTTEEIYNEGKDFTKLTFDMLSIFKDVLIYYRAPKYFENLNKLNFDEIKKIKEKIDIFDLELIIEMLENLSRELKLSDYPRILLEMFLINKKSASNTLTEEVKHYKEAVNEEQKEVINELKEERKIETELKKVETNVEEIKENLTIKQNEYTNETRIAVDNPSSEDKKILINNTIALASAKLKKEISEKFIDLDKYLIDKKYKVAATILKDATIAAVSNDHMLLTYKYVSMVEDNDKSINKITKLVNEITKSNYKIVAISIDEWKEMRPYYVELKKSGKIELLNEPVINESNNNGLNIDNEFDEVINAFGSELIEMEG